MLGFCCLFQACSFFQQDLHLYLFTCESVKDRYTKYFLPEYSSDVYSGVPGIQVYTRVSQ